MKLFGLFLLSILFLTVTTYAEPIEFQERQVRLSHGNDLNLLGETSGKPQGDELLTGTIALWYLSDTSLYELNLQLFTRHLYPQQDRVDLLTVGYLPQLYKQVNQTYSYQVFAGAHLIDSGEYGGGTLQDAIHTLTGNKHFDLTLSPNEKLTAGVAVKAFGHYLLSEVSQLYGKVETAWYGDGSGYIYNETGYVYRYGNYRFWGAVGVRHIEPFSNPVIVFSLSEKTSLHLLYGASVRFDKQYEVALEGTLGGAPLGEQHDYTSYLHLKYYFD